MLFLIILMAQSFVSVFLGFFIATLLFVIFKTSYDMFIANVMIFIMLTFVISGYFLYGSLFQ
ncbi:MAG TPA: hypothetical protein ENJ27_00780 [Candidatus Moranbacteria bacterium]|nr:hypothetical protein [Candidatus Moranbacteria bacterium]